MPSYGRGATGVYPKNAQPMSGGELFVGTALFVLTGMISTDPMNFRVVIEWTGTR